MDNDPELVARVLQGDDTAFPTLVARYREKVFRLAVSILGQEFVPEAEDVAQEVFLKVHDSLDSFRGDAEFGSWIYRITYNQALNLKARMRFRKPHLSESALDRSTNPDPSPQQQAEVSIRDQALVDCIGTLPEVYQAALRMYYWLELSVSEIAELLNVPENTAKSYLHRARHLLHGKLKQEGLD